MIAKGDANNSQDKPIVEEQVLGRVICAIPKVGKWRKVFLTPEVIIFIIILLLLLGVFVHLSSRTENKNDEH